MIITKIERQKRNKTRCSVFVDDLYAFSVSEEVYARFLLHTGQELTPEERKRIEQAEADATVKQVALRFRSFRPRSTKEVTDHLRKKGYDGTQIASAVAFLTENKLLDDAGFARMVCRDRMLLRPIGRQSMKQLLYRKGIDREVVESVLQDTFNGETERALALKEAERKLKRIRTQPPLQQKKRIYEHLLRRGYEPSLAMNITTQLVGS
ncbi:MAG: RecX family transcriptional regulator [Bacteroidetes bacterium]|nr:RecX family transcriptional regulator [Bacteroidota bacterium]